MHDTLWKTMKENKWTLETLAETIDVSYSTARRKMAGESEFTLREVLTIRAALHTDVSLMELFDIKIGGVSEDEIE